jgi:ATP-dependent Clp protease protease subunit
MIKKILFVIFQFIIVKSFDIKKFTASVLLSSSLHNNLPLENNVQLQNNHIQLEQKIQNNYINEYSSSIRISNNDIYFYGPITFESCNSLHDVLITVDNDLQIFTMNFNTPSPPINLHIQTGGGSLMDTFYIVDLIDNLKTPINTYVDGYVASAGSLLSVIGKKRYMTKNSFILIHQLSSSGEGTFNNLDDNMDNLNKFMNTIRDIYIKHTKIPREKLDEILNHDLWLTSNECLEYGLVDEIL